MIIRQGDVLLVSTSHAPRLRRVQPEDGRYILARGEATGHHHSIKMSDHVAMFRDDGGLFLVADQTAVLEHQEHAPLDIPAGQYRVLRQRTMTDEHVKFVVD